MLSSDENLTRLENATGHARIMDCLHSRHQLDNVRPEYGLSDRHNRRRDRRLRCGR